MPIYTYNCPKCGWSEERLAKFEERDDLHLACPSCDDVELARAAAEMAQFNTKGKYRMKAVMGDGTKRRVNNLNTDRKRSDS